MKPIRIACVISNSPVGNTRQNLVTMLKWIKTAKKKDVAIINFPEMNTTGYSTREGIKKVAEPVPGPISNALQQLAVSENIAILAGLAEIDTKGCIYATHLLIKPDGSIGSYRKLHIAPPEQAIFTAGNKIPIFEVKGVKFGIQLCYDAHFPELSTHMALNGADLIFIPHASPRGTPKEKFWSWMRHLPARAFDNSLFILANNQSGSNRNGLHFPGLAVAIDPSGKVISKNVSGKEGLMIIDLKAGALDRVRNHKMRFFLPNRRSDLFSI